MTPSPVQVQPGAAGTTRNSSSRRRGTARAGRARPRHRDGAAAAATPGGAGPLARRQLPARAGPAPPRPRERAGPMRARSRSRAGNPAANQNGAAGTGGHGESPPPAPLAAAPIGAGREAGKEGGERVGRGCPRRGCAPCPPPDGHPWLSVHPSVRRPRREGCGGPAPREGARRQQPWHSWLRRLGSSRGR